MSLEGKPQVEYASLSGKIHTLVIDKSLTISGAAADAKSVGDKLNSIESGIDKANKSVDEAKAAYEEAVAEMDEVAGERAEEAATNAVNALTAADLNAYTKEETLSADVKNVLELAESALPADAFRALKALVDDVETLANSRVRMEMGSYTGTGTYDSDNPNSLTFGFVPKFVFIRALYVDEVMGSSYGTWVAIFPVHELSEDYNSDLGWEYIGENAPDTYNNSRNAKIVGTTLYWYTTQNNYGDREQLNDSDYTYSYVAIR